MSDIYAMPGYLIRRLQQISSSVFADRMKALGLDLTAPQFAALAMLRQHPEIDQATLAGLIAFDRPTIGGVVDRLVGKGLVARQTNPADRRARLLTLSENGNALLDRLLSEVADIQIALLPGLTDEERATFIKLATKVAQAGNTLSRVPLLSPEI